MPHRFSTRLRLIGCWLLAAIGIFACSGSEALAQRTRAKAVAAPEEGGLGQYSTRNFRLVTDLAEPEAKELLVRLETMLKLVSGYFGRRNARSIDMYVARDLDAWPESMLAKMDPDGIAMIRSGGGLTLGRTGYINGRPVDARAVVYAVANHGTPQHEAVHAYCILAFGEAGPVWYSEGMAEVGQYWREGEKGVNAADEVIRYLKDSQRKPLDTIVNNPLETTGDSWQNYSWRWALCHLLGANENYATRFKPLGLSLLAGQDIDFWRVYGSQAAEIEFEYQFFLDHLETGFRCDLCSWDWKAKATPPRRSGSSSKVQAGRGWQASRLRLTAGEQYRYEASGEWQIDPDAETLTADGTDSGDGRLVGCIYHDFQLSEEFDLGAGGEFTAPHDGTLFLRCRDGWGSLADNTGTITCRVSTIED